MKTRVSPIEELDQAIAEVVEKLTSVTQDLAQAPNFKRGTPWWNDRAAARSNLLRKRDELYRERHSLVVAN